MVHSICGKTVKVLFAVCGVLLLQVPARGDDAAAKLYQSKCAACHAADGSGTTAAGKALKVNDQRSPDVQKLSDADIATIIAKGKDKMPSYEKTLKPDEIKSLVAYIRQLGSKK